MPLTAAASSCPTPPHPSNPYLHPLSLTAPSTFTAEDSSPTPLSAQAALDLSLIALSTSVKRFEEVAERLIVKARIEALDGDVAGFIDVCRENVTGNLYWRYVFAHLQPRIFITNGKFFLVGAQDGLIQSVLLSGE